MAWIGSIMFQRIFGSEAVRMAAILGALGCWGLVAAALYYQHHEGLDPCPLCIVQRYGFLLAGTGMWLIAFPKASFFRRLGCWVAVWGACLGLAAAARHLWVLAHPSMSCGVDALQTFVNSLWLAQWFPSVFYADGLCGAPIPPILGLDMPVWSAIGLACALTYSLLLNEGLRQQFDRLDPKL